MLPLLSFPAGASIDDQRIGRRASDTLPCLFFALQRVVRDRSLCNHCHRQGPYRTSSSRSRGCGAGMLSGSRFSHTDVGRPGILLETLAPSEDWMYRQHVFSFQHVSLEPHSQTLCVNRVTDLGCRRTVGFQSTPLRYASGRHGLLCWECASGAFSA